MNKYTLQLTLEELDYTTRSYSGRGMYGKECLGVELGALKDVGELVADLIEAAADDPNCADDVARGVRRMSWDNLGLGIIVYFPSVPFVDAGTDDHEDEENDCEA